ncbi:hypothetical protein ABG79_00939 [Caloramator mitchellensis]|uniref:Uncharacterized protein n=1 Tax=Caloramator mitchellensis TaxID=908809 RepID=A0A0R3K2D8_CALMK|nr:hypothetical protein [Caloramator mitchellensis]KRQ87141.1 hypothetical protein ABG79_00939 [Caloramator mitchellensis]
MINKKRIINLMLIFFIVLQVGCANGVSDKEEIKQETEIMEQLDKIIQNGNKMDKVIDFINSNISLVSRENASKMINMLEKEQEKKLALLEEKFYSKDFQERFIKLYGSGFDINNIKDLQDEELKKLILETTTEGYRIETAEGYFFPIIDYESYKKYSSYVTDDIKEYINIMSLESTKVPAKDAALIIGWNEVIERAINQERFIKNYPNSAKINEIKQLYKKYLGFILYGVDNTPIFNEDGLILKDVKNTYIQVIKSYKVSGVTEIIKDYIDILQNNNDKITNDADKFRQIVIDSIK